MATNTLATNFASDVSTYIAKKTLMLALKRLALYQVCEKVALPKNEGRTFQYTRYNRLNLPQSTLSEGVSPTGSSMSISTVSAVMDQWGDVVAVSDVAIDSVKHPVLQQAIELLSLQAAETVDREIAKVLLTGTNIFYPNAISARGSLTSSDKMASAVVGKVVSNLRGDGAIPYDGDLYLGVIDPFSEDDMTNDATFVLAAQYGAVKKLYNQEVGTWKGVRWIRSNSLPVQRLVGASTVASSATAGSLANSTAYDVSVSVVDAATGHETFIGAKQDVTTGASEESIDVTPPALPAGATAGSTYNIYAGTDGGTRYLAATGVAAGAVQNIPSIPTSGKSAQVSPPSGIPVHHAFIFGKQGIACIELNKIKTYLTPSQASDSDPLVQRRKAGWKCDFKAVICNDDFLARIEHATTNS